MSARLISIVLPDLSGGGAEHLCFRLAEEFVSRNHRVDIVVLVRRGELIDHVPPGVRVVALNVRRIRQAILPIARYLRTERPDALLAAMFPLTVASLVASALARVPTRIVISEHTSLIRETAEASRAVRWLLRPSIRWLYPRAHGVVAVSLGVARELATLGRLDPARIHVVANATASGRINNATSREVGEKWRARGHARLIAVGSLKKVKDYPTMMRAVEMLRTDVPVRLLVLGEGGERAAIERLARELNLDDVVEMPGYVSDPRWFIMQADLLLLSSTLEGFGNVLVEALSCGTPVVSTDCPFGPREILADGRYGALVPVGDAVAFAAAIRATLEKPVDRASLIARAASFSVERAADEYLALLVPER
jgi:glycosyltransferase involved in cell wall biosynthesis